MSWQQYVDQNLMCPVDAEGNTLTSAALVGHDGGVWAHSAQFPSMSPEQVAVVMEIFNGNNPGSFSIGDLRFMVLGSEDPSTKLRGKCKGGGCAISKTGQVLVVGIWMEPVTGPACNKVVETLAEYLVGTGY